MKENVAIVSNRIIAVLLVSIMTMTIVGCGSNENSANMNDTVEEVSEVVETTDNVVAEVISEEVVDEVGVQEEIEEEVDEVEVQEEIEEVVEEAAEEVVETGVETPEETKPLEEAKPAVVIPDWFDAEYYATNNADVVKAVGNSAEALYNHYKSFGKAEGRAAYEGDPNAGVVTAAVADAGSGNSNNSSGKWYDGIPHNQWVDMGNYFIYIGVTYGEGGNFQELWDNTLWMYDILYSRGATEAYQGSVSLDYLPKALAVGSAGIPPMNSHGYFKAPWMEGIVD